MESSEEDRFGYDGIGHRILTPSCPAHGKTFKDCGRTNHFAKAYKNPEEFCQRREDPGQEPRRLIHVVDAQIPTDDDIPMEDGDSHGGRRYPEDEDGRMTRCHRED